MTAETRSTLTKTRPSVTLSTTSLTLTGLVANPNLSSVRTSNCNSPIIDAFHKGKELALQLTGLVLLIEYVRMDQTEVGLKRAAKEFLLQGIQTTGSSLSHVAWFVLLDLRSYAWLHLSYEST